MGGKISSKLSSGPAMPLQMVFAMEGNEKVKKTQVSRAMAVSWSILISRSLNLMRKPMLVAMLVSSVPPSWE